ncbi:MAG: hypothetical protein AAF724_05060 [Pseudomonadota bacterium]
MSRFRKTVLTAILAMPLLAIGAIDASAQNADCSAAVRRVLNQTNGELLSVQVTKSGGQDICKITVLASDQNGERRRKMTVNARP